MELIVRLKGQCHKHEYEQSKFNRYSLFEENLNTGKMLQFFFKNTT